ncbi:hypothetical protein PRIPAC_84627 [Pristionchus pacificus]|nr:hypothetical protein PRIPAC_84627 [Pristionchus pacificus]|eukprot:PDM76578.1 hypothetical protein PRIPAC_42944 [Pristionchus pacificus]
MVLLVEQCARAWDEHLQQVGHLANDAERAQNRLELVTRRCTSLRSSNSSIAPSFLEYSRSPCPQQPALRPSQFFTQFLHRALLSVIVASVMLQPVHGGRSDTLAYTRADRVRARTTARPLAPCCRLGQSPIEREHETASLAADEEK